ALLQLHEVLKSCCVGEEEDTLRLIVRFADLPAAAALAGQLFFRGDKIYTAVCWSKDAQGKRPAKSGFLLVLDRATKKVLSAPGGEEPRYVAGKLQPLRQAKPVFLHGHDLYVDSSGDIYLGEWNAERRYPSKLTLAR
ncbi:MAG: hypothetical protein ACO3ND_06970, partial [Opitutales bacterium]